MRSTNVMNGSQSGLSLIELMVSITIGLILLAGMTTLFINQSRTQSGLERSGRMIENGRYAMQLLAGELQLAGYYGVLDPGTTTSGMPDPCATDPADLDAAMPVHVQGYNDATAGTAPSCIVDLKEGTDILVVRRAETTRRDINAAPLDPGNLTRYLQVTLCRTDPEGAYTVDRLQSNFTWRDRDCVALAEVRRVLSRIYYIANNHQAGDGIPTLKRVELDAFGTMSAPQALVEGIEHMQLLYGRDDDVDGVIDNFDDCAGCTEANFIDTLAVGVHVLARDLEATGGYTDTRTYDLGGVSVTPGGAFKRHVYSQFVRLQNPAGRRE